MDCLYFQVERTLREQRLFEVLKVAVIRNQLPYVSTKSGKIWPFEKKKKKIKAQNELKNIIVKKKKI